MAMIRKAFFWSIKTFCVSFTPGNNSKLEVRAKKSMVNCACCLLVCGLFYCSKSKKCVVVFCKILGLCANSSFQPKLLPKIKFGVMLRFGS